MDILKMVWYCADCDREFSREQGQRHRDHHDHVLQRYIKGLDKRLKNDILSKDDVMLTKNHEVNIDPQRLEELRLLRICLKEEMEWQTKFLKWIHQKKEELKICERFGYGHCSLTRKN